MYLALGIIGKEKSKIYLIVFHAFLSINYKLDFQLKFL